MQSGIWVAFHVTHGFWSSAFGPLGLSVKIWTAEAATSSQWVICVHCGVYLQCGLPMAWKQRGWGVPADPAVPLRSTAKLILGVGWVTIPLSRPHPKEDGAVLRQPCFSINRASEIWKEQLWDTSLGLWVLTCSALWHWKSIAVTDDKSSSPKGAELRAHLSNAWFIQVHLGAPGKLQTQHLGALLSLTNMGCPIMSVSAKTVQVLQQFLDKAGRLWSPWRTVSNQKPS